MKWKILTKNPSADLETELLRLRGLKTKAQLAKFFNPKLSDLHDAAELPNIEKAAARILQAVKNEEQIFIYGDFDVDGVCSTAIIFDFLYRYLGAKVLPYIPDRFAEGYGLGSKGLDYILEQGGKLVISVDCGIRDDLLVKKYIQLGLEFIITDHHALPEKSEVAAGAQPYPKKAVAVVHPGLPQSKYPYPEICATAVVYKIVDYISRKAKGAGLIKDEFDANMYLDLVALATYCDIMPVLDENRAILIYGLKRLQENPNPGLRELMNVARLNVSELDTYHLGFVLGPRLNAAGRVEHALNGVRLLTGKDKNKLFEIATKLDQLNGQRQRMTATMLEEAETQALAQIDANKSLIFVYQENWSEGVVGLVAGKLTEKYQKPTLAASIGKDSVRGSARSINGINITELIAESTTILTKFGGHSMAAGFTLSKENLPQFVEQMQTAAAKVKLKNSEPELELDLELPFTFLNPEFAADLEKFKPFGIGNKEPLFLIKNLYLVGKKAMGRDQNHLSFDFKTRQGDSLRAVAFNVGDKFAKILPGEYYQVAAHLNLDNWNGNKHLQLKIRDIKPNAEPL